MAERIYPNLATYFGSTDHKQLDLAEQLEISPSYMSRIVNRLAQPPLDLALKIIERVPVPLESLISEANEANQ
jgi:transcriptional regulator with XRE-family HTH domain